MSIILNYLKSLIREPEVAKPEAPAAPAEKPVSATAALAVLEPDALSAVAISELPVAPTVPGDCLPCEQVFAKVDAPDVDRDFLEAVAKGMGTTAKRIPMASVRQTRKGYLDLMLPTFALLDPFYAHPRGAAYTAVQAMGWVAWRGSSRSMARLAISPEAMRSVMGELGPSPFPGSGVIVGEVGLFGSFMGDPRVELTGDSLDSNRWMDPTPAVKAAYKDVPGNLRFALYCTLPGMIPTEYRDKILKARDVAKEVGGDLRLIVEAHWKLAATAVVAPRSADPLIVIVKGDNIAYIDRFDCTALETQLAREHAVKA